MSEQELLIDEIRDIARSMITCSLYDNLPVWKLDAFLKEIIAKVLKHTQPSKPNFKDRLDYYKAGTEPIEPDERLDRPELKTLLFELRDVGKKAAEEYSFYEGCLLVLIEDLMPILKRLGIRKKEWKDG